MTDGPEYKTIGWFNHNVCAMPLPDDPVWKRLSDDPNLRLAGDYELRGHYFYVEVLGSAFPNNYCYYERHHDKTIFQQLMSPKKILRRMGHTGQLELQEKVNDNG